MSYGQFAEFLEMLHEFMILFLFSKSCDPWFKSFPKTCQESGAYCRDNKVSNDVEGKTLSWPSMSASCTSGCSKDT